MTYIIYYKNGETSSKIIPTSSENFRELVFQPFTIFNKWI